MSSAGERLEFELAPEMVDTLSVDLFVTSLLSFLDNAAEESLIAGAGVCKKLYKNACVSSIVRRHFLFLSSQTPTRKVDLGPGRDSPALLLC